MSTEKNLEKILGNGGFPITEEMKGLIGQLSELIDAKDLSGIKPILNWLDKKRNETRPSVKEIGIKELDKWLIDPKSGDISHESGKFFSIIGVKVENAKGRETTSWTQPMIKQNERGILGIICQKRNGIKYYLLYAKFEPGAAINPQLAPTLQATKSNLSRAHGGKKPLFAEYFEKPDKSRILSSVVQVEDPGRFYLKTNRCLVVEVPAKEKIAAPDDFIWVTLPQIKKLLKVDYAINALARTVLANL